ncbi:lysine transporter LysE [Dokdonia pacifica]|uniref:Threonine/homoserine/homoserine lactone efflux protein n=1 Tax=Dokdonia pacifica TaxID=1627892 RepID=A0A238VYI8_9FLAO|nr:LysE family transporter [Dokdonia pacifica]GGG16500.1 lysine transporter LysE [Dokdonia pacifica]SNR39298.1 Threonine/homoserine/homoserine lactone efflux protein [Dokdonia pacifica]
METTKLFFITYFAALAGVIPPGLINMSVAKTCVQHGKNNGFLVAIGASLVVAFQALIAILLARYIFGNPFVRNMLLRTGLVIFLIMAIFFFVKAKRSRVKKVKVSKHAGIRSLGKGMMVSVLNVLPIPYFCALGAALNVSGKVEYDIVAISIFIAAAVLGTFTTLYLYVVFFARIENKSASFAKYSNYFMAALMLVLVIITLIRTIYFE